MYIVSVNDIGKATYTDVHDYKIIELDDLLSDPNYVMYSADLDEVKAFCEEWNEKHKNVLEENKKTYYIQTAVKGIMQAPALIILYTAVLMGIMVLFGSESFYSEIAASGPSAFGGGKHIVVIFLYIISAAIGLAYSKLYEDNFEYKMIRSAASIVCFIVISPIFFRFFFFADSLAVNLLTIFVVIAAVIARFILDEKFNELLWKRVEPLLAEVDREQVAVTVKVGQTPVKVIKDADGSSKPPAKARRKDLVRIRKMKQIKGDM